MTGNKLKQSVEIMHNLIYFFNNYVDDVFPEMSPPIFSEAIDCYEILEFASQPLRQDFEKIENVR